MSNRIYDDWENKNDHEDVFLAWGKGLSLNLNISYASSNKTIQHSRIMTLVWKSGKKTEITFDQGMGYWKNKDSNQTVNFNFRQSVEDQTSYLHNIYKQIEITNSANWATRIVISN